MSFDYKAVCGICMAAGLCLCPVASVQAAAAGSTSTADTAAAAAKADDNSLSAIMSRLRKSNTDALKDDNGQTKTEGQDTGTKEKKEKEEQKDCIVCI